MSAHASLAPPLPAVDCWRIKVKQFQFPLRITSVQYLDYYRGAVHHVIAYCADGTKVQFPAALLKPYVTLDGIHGEFVLVCDDDYRGAKLRRLTS